MWLVLMFAIGVATQTLTPEIRQQQPQKNYVSVEQKRENKCEYIIIRELPTIKIFGKEKKSENIDKDQEETSLDDSESARDEIIPKYIDTPITYLSVDNINLPNEIT